MKHYLVTACGLLITLVYSSHAAKEGETLEFGEEFTGLKAEVMIAPDENCKRYSKRGDLLSVHWKGFTAKDMEMFDSRCLHCLYCIIAHEGSIQIFLAMVIN